MELLLRPRYLLLALFTIVALTSDTHAQGGFCISNLNPLICAGTTTRCCYWTITSGSCCNNADYSATSSRRVLGYTSLYAYTSCYDLTSTKNCHRSTDSRCCFTAHGASSSCCDYTASKHTSSQYRLTDLGPNSAYIGAIAGGAVGAVIFLILIILIPVCACAVCSAKKQAAMANRGTVGVAAVSYNQPNQGYRNMGHNQVAPQQGYGQQGPPPGYTQQAPPGQMYPPAQQYTPPQNPAYPPS
ncbi:uncharacterized protein LOC135502160 [Lineus longissimus]|uniref:uncharacterized protein LOC135502160 n=1 Tax=Lineus longissimus TaxID=88925 RepID=UPI002B4C4018